MFLRSLLIVLTLPPAASLAYEVKFAHILANGTVHVSGTTAIVTAVTNNATGRYTVGVDGILAPGQVTTPAALVTAYGAGNSYCKLESFSFAQVIVRCFNGTGQAANSDFLLTFIPASNDRELSFAYADNPSAASYSAPLAYNTGGGGGLVTRSAAGTYAVTFPGLSGGTHSHAQVVAVGSDNVSCRLYQWTDQGGLLARVYCTNATATLTDSRFLIAVIGGNTRVRALGKAFFLDSGPDPGYSNTPEGAVSGSNAGGEAQASFSNLNLSGADGRGVMVTAWDSSPGNLRRCKVVSASQGTNPSVTVQVRCYDQSGNQAASRFSLMVLPRDLLGNGGFEAPRVTGSVPSNSLYRWAVSSGTPAVQRLVGDPADDGNQWLQMTSNGTPSTIFQDVPTTPGTGYQLSFAFANRSGSASSSIRVRWAGQILATIVRTNTAWQTYTYTVYGDSGSTSRLQLESLTSGNSADHLDDVRLALDPTAPPPPSVTVQTNPPNQQFNVDGVPYVAPRTFNWAPGSQHTLNAPDVIPAAARMRYVFANWSGSISTTTINPTVTAIAENTTYTANFSTQYELTLLRDPASGGTFTATPPSASGYYNAGATVMIAAVPVAGYGFVGFLGDTSGTYNARDLSMDGPKTVTARFAPCSPSISSPGASFPASGGAGTLTVTTITGCSWTVSILPEWITALPGGQGLLNYSVAPNLGAQRSFVWTVAGQAYTISQQAAAVTCVYTLNPSGPIQVPASGGSGAIQVNTPAGCPWNRGTLPAWLVNGAGTTITGPGSFTYTASVNTGVQRTAQVTLAGQAVTFVQAAAVTPPPPPPPVTSGLRFKSLAPCRLLETRPEYNFPVRTGEFGPPFLPAGSTRNLIPSQSPYCQVPASARAFVVNVTLVPRPGGIADFVVVWPQGETRPNVWTVRSPDGETVANTQIIKAGANGGISIYTSHAADVLLDISGYFTDDAAVSNLVFYPVTPCRVIDTRLQYRSPAGPFGPPSMASGQTRRFRFPETPYCQIPAGAAAYSVTLTVVPPGPLPFLTAWPAGSTLPGVSSINSFVGRTLANNVIVPAASDGSIDVYAYYATDFLMDINGYFAPDNGTTGQFYYPVTQCRVYDTTGINGPAVANESARSINMIANACQGISGDARGYAVNVTATPNGNPMPFVTAYPTGQPRPSASILNAFEGQTVTNFAIVPAGLGGQIDVFAYRRSDIVVEISGYFGR